MFKTDRMEKLWPEKEKLFRWINPSTEKPFRRNIFVFLIKYGRQKQKIF